MATYDQIRRAKVVAILQNDTLDFGSMLRAVRLVQGYKMKAVAHDIGMSPRTLEILEMNRFKRLPREEYVRNLASYYGLPQDYLWYKARQQTEAIQKGREQRNGGDIQAHQQGRNTGMASNGKAEGQRNGV